MDSVCSYLVIIFFFFFKQKTAYEMLRSLVGSEMCIRDRDRRRLDPERAAQGGAHRSARATAGAVMRGLDGGNKRHDKTNQRATNGEPDGRGRAHDRARDPGEV
eukprot:TRINITY_DN56602_c0_g1_i2.p2 TRINITY_DN56602_c0_g1~~TRINITY_DN56602_c0_g1_i2.p2  ORF type:complete len:104 (+),score=29.70 TRINITY_DN56602_c0_g1_i2:44-355(+)